MPEGSLTALVWIINSNLIPYGNQPYKPGLPNLFMAVHVVAFFLCNRKTRWHEEQWVRFFTSPWAHTGKISARGTVPGPRRGEFRYKAQYEDQMEGWEVQVKVANWPPIVARTFYFCTIVHLIYSWHQHIKYLSPALLRIPRYREQPISVFELFLVPKNLWLQNVYPHKSSTSGCWPCEKVHMSSEDGKKVLKFIPRNTAQLLGKAKMAHNFLPFSYSANVQWA